MVKRLKKVFAVLLTAFILMLGGTTVLTLADDGELLANPNFDLLNVNDLPEGWPLIGGSTGYVGIGDNSDGGTGNSLKIERSEGSGYVGVYQEATLFWAAGTIGELSYELNAVSGTANVHVIMYDEDDVQYPATKDHNSANLISGFGRRGFKFRAPEDKNIVKIRVYLRLSGTGEVYYDNLKLSTTKNLVTNGDFEYITPDTWTSAAGWAEDSATTIVEENGNHSLRIAGEGTRNVRNFFDATIANKTSGKNYRLSFNFKWDRNHPTFVRGTQSPLLTVRYSSGNDTYNRLLYKENPNEEVWTTYVTYLYVPEGKTLDGFTFEAWTSNMSIYYDDITLTEEVDSNVYFVKDKITAGEYTEAQLGDYSKGSGTRSNLNAEIYVPLTELTEGTAYVRYRHVSSTASSDKATLIAGLYREEDGIKRLVSVSNMENFMGSVETPLEMIETEIPIIFEDEGENVIYSLEAFVWEDVSKMTPLITKKVF